MDAIANNTLRINVTRIGNTSTIYLSGSFAFAAHREFKTAYKALLDEPSVNSIFVNLAEVNYLDSSALGMLLVLRDQVIAANKSLTLSHPSHIAERTFDIASFHEMFYIK